MICFVYKYGVIITINIKKTQNLFASCVFFNMFHLILFFKTFATTDIIVTSTPEKPTLK